MQLATNRKFRCLHGSQLGVFAPLTAIIAIAVVFILISYGIDSSTVRQASKALEKYNEQTCRQVAGRPVIHRDAVESFRKQIQKAVDEGLIRNVQLTEAKMILPTMPKDGDFAFAGNPVSEPYLATPVPFAALSACPGAGCMECKIDCASGTCKDCEYQGTVSFATSFPPSIWNNVENAGNTIACELSGKVNTVLLGNKTLTARSVWAASVRGNFKPNPPAGANDNPGLTLVLAPQMQSRAGDARFRFSTDAAYFDNTNFRPKYDPLYSFNESGNAPGLNAFISTPKAYTYPAVIPTATNTAGPTPTQTVVGAPAGPTPAATASWKLQADGKISSKCRAYAGGSGSCDGGDDQLPEQNRQLIGSDYASDPDCLGYPTPSPGSNCMVLSDREEMLAACMNPPVLIRNIIASTLLELAMRHGELRNMTEILLANPKNRNEKSADYIVNNPVQLIGHGEDLANRGYQLPFVFFHGGGDIYGNDSDLPQGHGHDPDYRPHLFGVINPFDIDHHQIAALPSAQRDQIDSILSYHRLVANQLRYCYHLFHEGQTQAISRYDIPGLVNDGFEPNASAAPKEVYAFDNVFREPYPFTPDLWDQESPWGGAMTHTRGLNGPELASALGSVQLCPYYKAGLPSPPFALPQPTPLPAQPNEAGVCLKPANPEEDLRGDLLGTLCYLKGPNPSSKCPSSFPRMAANVFPAIKRPGLFPMLNPNTAKPAFDTVNAEDAYVESINSRTPIVLITHQPLTSDERRDIQDLIDEGHFDRRPITIIFVQAWEQPGKSDLSDNRTYLDDSIIKDFKRAFDIPEQFDASRTVGPGNRDNAIFVFSPYLISFTPSTATCSTTPSACFSDYWKYLLDSTQDENVHVAATNIFYNRILKIMLKL